ncbi:hypothetical protein HDU98_005753 [Podochytrium sp. JEL0797]|nr:hypothetical protein HDU98_005753 [Podochytrium sp. JEL0797]
MRCRKREKNDLGQYISCNEECTESTSNSAANPGRKYWSCPKHVFSHWVPGSSASIPAPATPVRDYPTSPSSRYTPYTPVTPQKPLHQHQPPAYNPFNDEESQGGSSSSRNFVSPPSSQIPLDLNFYSSEDVGGDTEDEETVTVRRESSTAISKVSSLLNKVLAENTKLKRENERLKREKEAGGAAAEAAALKEEVARLKKNIRKLTDVINAQGE